MELYLSMVISSFKVQTFEFIISFADLSLSLSAWILVTSSRKIFSLFHWPINLEKLKNRNMRNFLVFPVYDQPEQVWVCLCLILGLDFDVEEAYFLHQLLVFLSWDYRKFVCLLYDHLTLFHIGEVWDMYPCKHC